MKVFALSIFQDMVSQKFPRHITKEWKELIESYLLGRGALRLAILVLDARRGWMEKDVELKDWLEAHGRPYLVVATKVDKLKTQKERHLEPAGSPRRTRGGSARMLGHHRPGSEGNLASDLENQDQSLDYAAIRRSRRQSRRKAPRKRRARRLREGEKPARAAARRRWRPSRPAEPEPAEITKRTQAEAGRGRKRSAGEPNEPSGSRRQAAR